MIYFVRHHVGCGMQMGTRTDESGSWEALVHGQESMRGETMGTWMWVVLVKMGP